jgi:MFS family permease
MDEDPPRPRLPGDPHAAAAAPITLGMSGALAVTALCLTGLVVYGSRGSLGLFLAPWQERFVASRGSVALVSTLGFLVFAAAQPLAGRLLERMPGRRIVVTGLMLCGLGFAGAAVAESLWAVVVLIGGVTALGTGLASLPVLSVLATETVRRREGLVFGLLTAAAAGGQVVVLPLATAALGASVSTALLVIAGLLVVAAIAVFSLAPAGVGSSPGAGETAGRRTASTFGGLLREPRFWRLLVPFFICGYTTTGLIDTHFIPHAVDHRIDTAVASSALATLAAFNVAGVLVAGALTDRVNRGRLLAGIYAVRGILLLLLPLLTAPGMLFVFAALFGLADFATVPPTTALTRRVFQAGGWAVALGLISAAHQVGSALGAYLPGWVFARTGDHTAAFTSAAIALAFAAFYSLRLQYTPTVGERTATVAGATRGLQASG